MAKGGMQAEVEFDSTTFYIAVLAFFFVGVSTALVWILWLNQFNGGWRGIAILGTVAIPTVCWGLLLGYSFEVIEKDWNRIYAKFHQPPSPYPLPTPTRDDSYKMGYADGLCDGEQRVKDLVRNA
jgi:hypothetical protein